MNPLLSCLVTLFFTAEAQVRPEPHPIVGEALPAGAVARLGPNAFRYAGWVNVLHGGGPTVCYAPDGKRVAVTSNAGVYVWDATSGKRLLWVPADGDMVTGFLGFHPDGDVIVDCRRRWDDGGGGVFRIDPATGKLRAKFQPTDNRRFSTVSPDGKTVFAFTSGNTSTTETVANDIDTGKELWRKKHPEMGWSRVSPDGSRLVTWTFSATWQADVLDAATGKTVGTFEHKDGYTPSWTSGGLAVGPNADVVISAHAWNRGFSVFKAGTTKPVWAVEGPWYENAFVTDGGKKAVLIRQRKGGFDVETWDIATNKPLAVVAADVGRTMALSPDGATFATSDRKTPTGTLQFVDVATGKLRPQSPEAFTRAAVVWYLPDGTLASADEKASEAVAWNLKTGAITAVPAGTKPPTTVLPGKDFRPPEGTASVVMAADGKHALGYRFDPDELDSVPGDTYLGLFDGTGRVVKKYPRPDQMLGAKYAFAPDGGTFAVARGDGTITLYDTTGAELRTLRHGGGVTSLAYSPDGKFLATACGDGPILVWDVAAKR